jgi:hypothetical protein
MGMKIFFTFLIASICLWACGQSFPYKTELATFCVSDKGINILKHNYGEPQLYFLSLHDNEDTGVKAAFEFMRLNGGSLLELKYGSVRNIVFCADSAEIQIDPNRIFSKPGIEAFFQHDISSQRISAFADTLLHLYDYQKVGYILTLHNNTDSAFSIRSYLDGGERDGVASEIFINPDMDADDFVLVTEPFFFNYLKSVNISTVLQNNMTEDDGSLSVYAGMRKIPYINVEVQHRHLDENLRLINAVNIMIQEYRKQNLTSGQESANN